MSARLPPVRVLVAVAGLLAIACVLASLGAWQMRRAAESRALGEHFASAANEPALDRAPDEVSEALRFRRLRVQGSYAPERQFLLDNRVHEGVAGYEVLTPLRLADEHRWLLVNRGWVPVGIDRSALPDVAVDADPREVTGLIERLPRPGMQLGTAPIDSAPVAVVLYPTGADLAAALGEPLLDYALLLDPEAADGYVREWPAPGLAIERHLAYAGQWLLLALGALGAGIAIAIRAARAQKPRAARSGS